MDGMNCGSFRPQHYRIIISSPRIPSASHPHMDPPSSLPPLPPHSSPTLTQRKSFRAPLGLVGNTGPLEMDGTLRHNFSTCRDPTRIRWGSNHPPRVILLVKKWHDEESYAAALDLGRWLNGQAGVRVLTALDEQDSVPLPRGEFSRLGEAVVTFEHGSAHPPSTTPQGSHEQGTLLALSDVDLALVVGGDGSVLHLSALFGGACPPVLAVGSGGSLGFLTVHTPASAQLLLARVMHLPTPPGPALEGCTARSSSSSGSAGSSSGTTTSSSSSSSSSNSESLEGVGGGVASYLAAPPPPHLPTLATSRGTLDSREGGSGRRSRAGTPGGGGGGCGGVGGGEEEEEEREGPPLELGTAGVSMRMRLQVEVYRYQHQQHQHQAGGGGGGHALAPAAAAAGAGGESAAHLPHLPPLPESTHIVLNECLIERGGSPAMAQIRAFVDGEALTTVLADGLIISTQTGSTAYALSAGGSILSPATRGIMFCPVCPHTLSFRPVVLSDSAVLKLVVSRDARCAAVASFDGRDSTTLQRGDYLVVRACPWPLPLLVRKNPTADWLGGLRQKLLWNVRSTFQKPSAGGGGEY